MLRTSDQIDKLAPALAAMQANVEDAKKNAANPMLRNKYADLGSTLDALRPALSAQGLAIIQGVGDAEPTAPIEVSDRSGSYTARTWRVTITSRLVHASGQWIEATIGLPATSQRGITDAQAIGIAITYARRYAAMALCGIVGSDDDTDGETRHRAPREPAREARREEPRREPEAPAAPPAGSQATHVPTLAERRASAYRAARSLGILAEIETKHGAMEHWSEEVLGEIRAVRDARASASSDVGGAK